MLEETDGRAAVRLVDGIPVVDVEGELDLTNVKALEDALHAAAQHDVGVVIVSLTDTRYFDSATFHALFSFREHLAINRQRLLIVPPVLAAARRLCTIAGLTLKHETLADALAAAAHIAAERYRALEPSWREAPSD